ncbi:nuclear transport factor 2 family protein [Pelagicoccus sp. SDUM812003]|uniref:YybH family protein n=1 Tax=Pelagicoccus sp. SDUM812003 TaxID=3041267 RepID=UPI00280F7565|nr:nuclear transport factor 2 family protein [Pelagicoccus sp. SDUM812003]MDQ8201395.1 nuclear transport factor 2 family protein [Pelagicoccus sp. SDUM812003]
MTKTNDTKADEAKIRKLMADWSDALERKDVDGLVANYASDVILFDAIPPYKRVGVEEIRDTWTHCLPHFPETFQSEHRDITVQVAGDVAFAYGVHHIVADDHPAAKSWMRVTVGFRRIEGQWKVMHEHVSLPFNPMDNQAWSITDPEVLSQPDYSGACAGG